MAKPRSVAQWNALDAKYRKRLESNGITRAKYVRGDNLQLARRGTTPERPGRKLSPVQKAAKARRPARKTERPFGPITKERHQKDVRNARERARRYSKLPKSKREQEWEKHSADTLFWANFDGDSSSLMEIVNR